MNLRQSVVIDTSPDETVKLSEVNLLPPMFDVLANSPAIVNVLPEAVVFIPSPQIFIGLLI